MASVCRGKEPELDSRVRCVRSERPFSWDFLRVNRYGDDNTTKSLVP